MLGGTIYPSQARIIVDVYRRRNCPCSSPLNCQHGGWKTLTNDEKIDALQAEIRRLTKPPRKDRNDE